MELEPIATDELAKFIKQRFAKIAISISGQLALRIAERVNGHPDYAQRLCSHIFDIIESNTVEEEHVERPSLLPMNRGSTTLPITNNSR